MELEKQLTSLEPSKRLAELGVKQESLFYWIDLNREGFKPWLQASKEPPFSVWDEGTTISSAFTVAELGKMLYEAGAKNFIKAYGDVFNFPGTSFVGDLGVMNLMRKPDMAANLLIYLIEKDLLNK